jgi:hypothetical protein
MVGATQSVPTNNLIGGHRNRKQRRRNCPEVNYSSPTGAYSSNITVNRKHLSATGNKTGITVLM